MNWYVRHDATTYLVSLLTQARLVRINGTNQQIEPWLAEHWTRSADGLTYTIALRPGLQFSDGHPMTADDVVFSASAAFEGSSLGDALTWGGQRLRVTAIDARTVSVTFPTPYGPGLRILDALPILPKHKLADALTAGKFADAWTVSSDPSELVGLGPFRLVEHRQGERLVFERNPHYFRRDVDGAPLPRLGRIVIQVLPNQDTQMLSLEAGDSDGSAFEIRPGDYASVRRLAEQGRVQTLDLGPAMDPDGLWVNLKPGAFAGDSRSSWIQRDELRQAIALGVDRQRFVDVVFSGAGTAVFGPVSPSNKTWFAAPQGSVNADVASARRRLADLGLVDRDGDGILDDQGTRHARLTLLTQKGQTALERGANEISEQMRALGLQIDVVATDAGELIQRFLSGHSYDAVYFNLTNTDTDPASQLDFWTSDGGSHVWNLGPRHDILPWEKELDRLMAQQVAADDQSERVRLFRDAQAVFAEHQPMVYFAVPRVFVAVSSRLTNLTPAIARPQLLWAADTLDTQ